MRPLESAAIDSVDLGDPSLHIDDSVLPYFAQLRREDPVHFYESRVYGPYWSVTRYQDIMQVAQNHQIFSSQGSIVLDDTFHHGGNEGEGVELASFISMDPPKHDEQRRAVAPALSPQSLRNLQIKIEERVARVLDSLPRDVEFDWVDRVAVELTTQMLATLIDFPFDERAKLTRWSNYMTGTPGDGFVNSWEERADAMRECGEYLAKLWQDRRQAPPASDLISMLAHSPATRDMTHSEFLANMILLIVGGNDTTRNSMTGGLLALNQFPAEYAKLRANSALVETMVPEIVRWQTPIAHVARRALTDTELGGKRIRKGQKVVMWYLSGNRDEQAIEEPNRFIIDRARPRQHLSFGFGIHRCLGNRLAELQLRILWQQILKRFDRIEVTGPAVRVRSNLLRAFSSMPVRVHAH